MKKCNYCAEEIQDDAIKCKHCGSMLITEEKTKIEELKDLKKCLFCSEAIQEDAIKCKHCGANLTNLDEDWRKCRVCGIWTLASASQCRGCNNYFGSIDSTVQIKKGNELSTKDLETHTTTLKCPRCGHEDTMNKFKNAHSNLICFLLACLYLIPGILYYFFMRGKKVCPKCNKTF